MTQELVTLRGEITTAAKGVGKMQLPYFQSAIKELSLLQTKWRSILNPFLSNPGLNSQIIPNVFLENSTTTVINHGLGRVLLGWRLVRVRAAANIYDTQDSNQTPELTLILRSSANVIVNLEVF